MLQDFINLAMAQQQQLFRFLEECSALTEKVKANLAENCRNVTGAREELQKLTRLVSEIATSIPPYELRKAQEVIADLQSKIVSLETESKSRPPSFKFTRKETGKPKSAALPDAPTENVKEKHVVEHPTSVESRSSTNATVAGVKGQNITLDLEQTSNKDLWLDDLEQCRISIIGIPSTLHMTRLKDCTVIGAAVLTSIFLDSCERSTFVAGCQQLRAHKSTTCDFYLHVRSRAIIEDCCNCRFAPYGRNYDGKNEDFIQANLDPLVNNWNQIDDFNWLGAKPSPNWSVIPENDRVY